MKKHERQRSVRVDEWPPTERRLLDTAFAQGGRRYQHGPAHHWSTATRRTVLSGYCCGLGWLYDRGLLDWQLAPSSRWSASLVDEYVAELDGKYARATVYARISALERAIAILEPTAGRSHLLAALRGLGKPGGNPERIKHVQSSADLLQLGFDLMDEAERGERRSPRLVAALFRDGLQIALLAMRFIRLSEFQHIGIGKHVFQRGGAWRLHPSLADTPSKRRTKAGRIPKILEARLVRYLNHFRPMLCDGRYHGSALWVSTERNAQSQTSIRDNVVKHTAARFGDHVSVHDFRRSGTTTMAIHNPANIDAASVQLGHTGPRTREAHYDLATSMTASADWNQARAAILKRARERRRPKRRLR